MQGGKLFFPRSISADNKNSPFYGRFDRWAFYVHLLQAANWKPGERLPCGRVVGRGQLVTSRLTLAKLMGMSEGAVRNHLSQLTKTGRIIVDTYKSQRPTLEPIEQPIAQPIEQPIGRILGMVITICDYDSITSSESKLADRPADTIADGAADTTTGTLATSEEALQKKPAEEALQEPRTARARDGVGQGMAPLLTPAHLAAKTVTQIKKATTMAFRDADDFREFIGSVPLWGIERAYGDWGGFRRIWERAKKDDQKESVFYGQVRQALEAEFALGIAMRDGGLAGAMRQDARNGPAIDLPPPLRALPSPDR